MLTRMTGEDWTFALEVFDAAQSSRGEPGRDDRKFLEAILYFTVHNISWRALPAESGSGFGGSAARECLRRSSSCSPSKAAPHTWCSSSTAP